MTNPVGRPRKPGGVGKSVRIDTDLANKARVICLRSGTPLSDYLSELLKPLIDRDYRATLEELSRVEAEAEKADSSKTPRPRKGGAKP